MKRHLFSITRLSERLRVGSPQYYRIVVAYSSQVINELVPMSFHNDNTTVLN